MKNNKNKIALLVLIISIIMVAVTSKNPNNNEESSPSIESSSQDTNNLDESESLSELVEDDMVKDFINNYNKHSTSPLTEIDKGNIRTKYFAYSYGYYIQMLHSNETDKIDVTINNQDQADMAGMREVFHDVCISVDSTLTSEEINSYFDKLAGNDFIIDESDELSDKFIVEVHKDFNGFSGRIDIIGK